MRTTPTCRTAAGGSRSAAWCASRGSRRTSTIPNPFTAHPDAASVRAALRRRSLPVPSPRDRLGRRRAHLRDAAGVDRRHGGVRPRGPTVTPDLNDIIATYMSDGPSWRDQAGGSRQPAHHGGAVVETGRHDVRNRVAGVRHGAAGRGVHPRRHGGAGQAELLPDGAPHVVEPARARRRGRQRRRPRRRSRTSSTT